MYVAYIRAVIPGQDPFWLAMQRRDFEALDTLALLHRIAAGLFGAISLCGVPALLLGASANSYGPITGEDGPPPHIYGGVFILIGGGVFALHFALAILFWLAGGWIKHRRCHTTLIVLDVLLLLWTPLGTALGIYGLILLTKPHVRTTFS